MINVSKNSLRLCKTEYKYVSEYKWLCGKRPNFFVAFYPKKNNKIKNIRLSSDTAKGAALLLDKELVKLGLEPVNIL